MHGENKFEFKLFYDLFSFILPPFDSKYLRANIRKVQANPGALHTPHHSRPPSHCHLLIQWLHNTSKQRLSFSISVFAVSSTTIYDHEHRTAVFLEQMTHSNSQRAGSPIVIAQMLKGSIKRSCCVWQAWYANSEKCDGWMGKTGMDVKCSHTGLSGKWSYDNND